MHGKPFARLASGLLKSDQTAADFWKTQPSCKALKGLAKSFLTIGFHGFKWIKKFSVWKKISVKGGSKWEKML